MKGELQLEPSGERNPSDSDPLLQNQHVDSPSSSSPSSVSSGEIKNEDIEAGSVACCRICLECDGEEAQEIKTMKEAIESMQGIGRYGNPEHPWLNQFKVPDFAKYDDPWNPEGFAFSHCTTCKAQFHLRVEEFEDNSWRKIKFRVFVARDVFLVFLAVQTVIGAMGGFAYVMDKDGSFRNSFNDSWDRILSKHPIPFYYCIGVLAFFVLLGFFGLVLHCSSLNSNDPRMAGCQNCCYGWGILDCFPASMEACFALVIVFVVVFAILGIAYGFLAATMAIQRIWQRHYHILTKRELTKIDEKRAQQKAIDDWLPITSSRNAKWWYSAFHNVTAMVGAGVLSLPYAMAALGWGPGVVVLILSWFITLYTLWQMVEMHEMVPGKRFDRYHELEIQSHFHALWCS
ncbi:hypothetical protein TEA_018642 [Camellia sinensis var. sinensis]|uniref:Amino acid transporter transmembrane domain-containing protein n=1 Tax=Camellia sinensis var. sinensis TaxID=542762 RepID=A0A4S4E9N7_CAMSN|nr:hypothetical protein TEA_018642 [Camellia sinensis var. sinensis]